MYQKYQLEDFLKDDDFIRWVKYPTEEQNRFWEAWLREHPDKKHTVALARELIQSVRYKHSYTPSEADINEVWERIQAGAPPADSAPIIWFPASMAPLLRLVAAILLTATAAVLLWQYTLRNRSAQNLAHQTVSPPLEVRTKRGQRELIQLPDGSRVKLNAETVLRYPADFGQTGRALSLEGEAFFEVAPDPSKPFTIQTAQLTTTVVGTSFAINAYPENPDITVAVLSGKVKVGSSAPKALSAPQLLLPSDLYSYDKTTETARKEHLNLDDWVAWKDDVIILKNASFEEIKKKLERWYSVQFVVQKGVKVREDFSARFSNTSLKSILDALNYTSNFHYELVNNTVYVSRKK